MGWYSILPPTLATLETWIIRIFVVVAVLNLIPWTVLILYDLFLYLGRWIWYLTPAALGGGGRQGGRAAREARHLSTSASASDPAPPASTSSSVNENVNVLRQRGGGEGGDRGRPSDR